MRGRSGYIMHIRIYITLTRKPARIIINASVFRRPVPESRVKSIVYQLLRGLEHLHRHGFFHRDIKPENILLKVLSCICTQSITSRSIINEKKKQESIVKIGDLGSARPVYGRPPFTEYISTRWYRSPECLLTGGFYGPKMDVWAVGCVFYELLTCAIIHPCFFMFIFD